MTGTRTKKAARAYMAEHGVNYTRALRAVKQEYAARAKAQVDASAAGSQGPEPATKAGASEQHGGGAPTEIEFRAPGASPTT